MEQKERRGTGEEVGGDLEEGISHEVCSWAGAMKLDDLVLVYDSNHITIEGDTSLALNDNTKLRFQSYGWKVFEVDGHDPEAIHRVYMRAEKVTGQPVLIIATTHIGYGSPTKQDTADCHGAPLGADEVAGVKKALGFNPDESFVVSQEIYDLFAARAALCHRWRNKDVKVAKDAAKAAGTYGKKPETDEAFKARLVAALPKFDLEKPVATRAACGRDGRRDPPRLSAARRQPAGHGAHAAVACRRLALHRAVAWCDRLLLPLGRILFRGCRRWASRNHG